MGFFKQPADKFPYEFYGWLRDWFYKAPWFEVYDFIEALYSELKDSSTAAELAELTNQFLETEMSAFRLVDGHIADITSKEEIEAIEAAGRDTQTLGPVHTHLREALAKLTDRKNPDYRNSIKEAVSAVEGICQLITGDRKATLGTALKKAKDAGVQLHPALEQAWIKLYGYTSDAGGIRHALTDEPNIGRSEATYMLVSCSAFVSHLIELSRAAGISLEQRNR
jgi:hypothetical protein